MPYLPPPSSLPSGSIVDSYRRDSGGSRQDQSTDQQLTEIQAFCNQHGLTLRHNFVDEAKSGGSTAGRDDFNRMIDLYRNVDQRPRGLLLWNYARFARDLDDAIYYKALLRNRDITVHSLTDPIPEGQYGRIIEFFIDISNEEKRRQTSADAKRGLRDLVQKYGCVPGTPPRGFKTQPVQIGTRRDGSAHQAHRWVPDPDVIPRVQQAFRMKAEGASLAQIHSQIRLYTGLPSYKSMFTNSLYIGILEFGDLVIEKYCKPIIDMATWNTVQKRIEGHTRAKYDRHHPRRAHSPYILSGLVYCGQCGSPMSANTVTGGQRGRNEAYRCSRSKRRAGCTAGRIGRRTLEDAVTNTLTGYIFLPENLAEMFAIEQRTYAHHESKKQEQLQTLNAQKKKLNTNITNLTRAIAERGHSEALLNKLTELEAERAEINTQITELNKVQLQPAPPLSTEQIIALSKTLNEKLTLALPDEIRTVLLGFIHKITVQKDGDRKISGTITYYLPTSPTLSAGEGPPFDIPLSPETGYNLPMESPTLGAQLYRQTYIHPIIAKPRSR